MDTHQGQLCGFQLEENIQRDIDIQFNMKKEETSDGIKLEPIEHIEIKQEPIAIKEEDIVATIDASTNQTSDAKDDFRCELCGKSFVNHTKLSRHVRCHIKPYTCEVCSRCFISTPLLKDHQRTHTGERPHKCKLCGKCFARKGYLAYHERRHTGERPFKCQVCNKSFLRCTNLVYHQRTHTGWKPHKCQVCDQSFAVLSDLKAHNKIHIAEEQCSASVDSNFSLSSQIRRSFKEYVGYKGLSKDQSRSHE